MFVGRQKVQKPPTFQKGAKRMNLAIRMSKAQLVLFVLIVISLIVTALFVIHAAMPGVWHATVDGITPNIQYWHP